jgi:hypothetical protein
MHNWQLELIDLGLPVKACQLICTGQGFGWPGSSGLKIWTGLEPNNTLQ